MRSVLTGWRSLQTLATLGFVSKHGSIGKGREGGAGSDCSCQAWLFEKGELLSQLDIVVSSSSDRLLAEDLSAISMCLEVSGDIPKVFWRRRLRTLCVASGNEADSEEIAGPKCLN